MHQKHYFFLNCCFPSYIRHTLRTPSINKDNYLTKTSEEVKVDKSWSIVNKLTYMHIDIKGSIASLIELRKCRHTKITEETAVIL